MTHTERRERRRQMAARIKAGDSPQKVQRDFGVTATTLNKACAENNVRLIRSRSGTRPPLTIFRFIALLQSGKLSQSAIANELGVSRQLVSVYVQRAREAGIQFRAT